MCCVPQFSSSPLAGAQTMTTSTNLFSIYLKHLRLASRGEILVEVLAHVEDTIQGLDAHMVSLLKGLDPENAQSLSEFADATKEHLIGGALAACQTALTTVVTRVVQLHEHAKTSGHSLSSVPTKKDALLASHSPLLGTTGVTEVMALESLANYFKHRDQWLLDWAKADKQAQSTIANLRKLGFSESDKDIILKGVKMIAGLHDLPKAIDHWQSQIADDFEKELKSIHLV